MRSVIVEDEPPSRELLESLLESSGVEVVGSFDRSEEALAAIPDLEPDVLFVDVRMPGLDGIELLERLGPEAARAVVFVTAYDQYALSAFEHEAVDYLLKPFDDERLARTLDRVRRRLDLGARATLVRAGEPLVRIPVAVGDRVVLVPVAEVVWFEAEGKYVRIHTPEGAHLVRMPLSSLEARLEPREFLRVSRSAIVRIASIREIQPWTHGDRVLVLRTGAHVRTTRGYRDNVSRLLRP